MLALQHLQSTSMSWTRFTRALLTELKDEVRRGVTILMETGSGEVERVVSVVAFEITDARDTDSHRT